MSQIKELEQDERELSVGETSEEDFKKKTKKKDDFVIETSFLETKDYILEQIIDTEGTEHTECSADVGDTFFLKYSKLNGEIEKIKEFAVRDKLYRPITDKIYQMKGVRLPTGVKEYKNTKEITDHIRVFLKENIDVPPFYEGLFPNLLLFYWVYERFPFIPYLSFIGGTGTGKTTAMLDFGNLCYKPINTTGSLTISSIFRVATKWKGTLLIDEFYKIGEHANEIITFLKAGVSDQLILRTEGEKTKDVNVYVVKAPKVFTSERSIDDAGLNSRTLFVQMQKSKRRLPLFRLDEYYEEANEIRNKLLLWRFRNLNNIDLRKIRFGFDEFKGFDGRVQQILTGIYYLSDDESKKSILEYANKQEKETKRERRDSLPGMVFELLCRYWDRKEPAELKTVTSVLNEERRKGGYKIEYTERKLGNLIRKELGFETERGGQMGNTFIVRNEEIEANQREYFDLPASVEHSVPSVPSVESTDTLLGVFDS